MTKLKGSKKSGSSAIKASSSKRRSSIPLALASSIGPRPNPRFTSSRGKLVVSHSEYIATVAGVGAFVPIKYTLQPGIPSSFPWLYPFASRYETYRFQKLVFSYTPSCSAATGGQFGMVFDFDPLDLPPTDLLTALSYFDRAHGSVYGEHRLVIDLNHEDAKRSRYNRASDPPAGSDLKTYDLGNLFYYCDATVARAGLLSVEYTVEFSTPQCEPLSRVLGATLRSTDETGATALSLLQGASALAGSTLPASLDAGGLLTFTDSWEGIINTTVQSLNLKGLSRAFPSVTGGVASFIHGIQDHATSGTQTLMSVYKYQMGKGGTINLGLTDPSVVPLTVDADFATAPYLAIS